MHIIFLPGLDGSGLFFEGFRETLPSTMDTQVLSYPRDECQTYQETVDLIYEQLPRDNEYFIVAESFSGPVAIEIASLTPLKLKGLALVSSFCFSPLSQLKKQLAQNLLFLLHFPASQALIHKVLCNGTDLALSLKIKRVVDALPTSTLKQRILSALNVDLRGALDDVEVPLLILQGMQDRLLDPSCGEMIKRYYEAAEFVQIDGPHCLLQCEPEASSQVIVPFIERNHSSLSVL
jgi:pimeloyl-ACP methyl ester carboxylesterase